MKWIYAAPSWPCTYIDCGWRHVRNWFSSITHQCSHTSHSRVKLKYLLQMRGKNNRATPLITLENPFLAHHLLTSHAILLLGTHNIQYKKSIWFYLAFHSPFPLQWKKGTQLGQRRYLKILKKSWQKNSWNQINRTSPNSTSQLIMRPHFWRTDQNKPL